MTAGATWVGVDIGGTKIAMGAVTSQGTVVARATEEMAQGAGVRLPEEAAAAVGRFVHSAGLEPEAVGVSVAAALDPLGNMSFAPNLPGWQGMNVTEAFRTVLGRPVVALYDGHAALVGEAWLGAARDRQAAALLVIGTGLGGAFMSRGRLVQGRDGLAGVFGFLPIPGGRGGGLTPLESRVSGPALAARLAAETGGPASSFDLFARARDGDSAAVRVLDQAIEDLALGLGMVASVLNPDVILLGGGLGEAFAAHAPRLQASMRRYAQPISARALSVRAAALGNDAGWLGAARWAALGSAG